MSIVSLREAWPKGQQFTVVRAGGYLDGWQPVPDVHYTAHRGWRYNLAVGDVITCLGFGPGWGSDPGYGVHWTCEAAREALASAVQFQPSEGHIFSFKPKDGYLHPKGGYLEPGE